MALTLDATLTFTADKVLFENTTGDYDAENNTGGYGTPNPAFEDLAHYVIIRKKNVNNVDDQILVPAVYDVESDTEYSADRDVDGWFEGTLLGIVKWSAGSVPANTVRYHDGAIYMSNQTTTEEPGTGAQWNAITDLEDIEDNNTVYKASDGRVTAYNADLYWSKQIAANSRRGRCGLCQDERQKERLDRIYCHIKAVVVADQFGNNTSGEWNVLSLIQLGAVIDE